MGGLDVIGRVLNVIVVAIESNWSLAISIIGAFIGIAGWLIGDHQHKGVFAKVIIGCTLLLSLNQFVGWMHS